MARLADKVGRGIVHISTGEEVLEGEAGPRESLGECSPLPMLGGALDQVVDHCLVVGVAG